jgi:hypothetical protein
MNMGTTASLLPYDLIRQDATDSEITTLLFLLATAA